MNQSSNPRLHRKLPYHLSVTAISLLVGAVAFLGVLSQQQSQPFRNESVNDVASIDYSIKNSEPSKWKVYTDEEFGFSISYPASWEPSEVDQNIQSSTNTLHIIKFDERISESAQTSVCQSAVTVSVDRRNQKLLVDWYKEHGFVDHKSLKEITIGSVNAIEMDTYAFGCKSKIYIVQHGQGAMNISFHGKLADMSSIQKQADDLRGEILASFKLTHTPKP